ncbi:MAG: EH signature domain-containing protein [Fluviibacter phosphoraccumulans]
MPHLNIDIDQLRRSLEAGSSRALSLSFPSVDLSSEVNRLQKIVAQGTNNFCPPDRVLLAAKEFWNRPVVKDINQARYLAFGLAGRYLPGGTCMFDHAEYMVHLLSDKNGIGQWKGDPKWFRRPVQGLVSSYFSYDPEFASESGKENWRFLRSYIKNNLRYLLSKTNPDWVVECEKRPDLFSDNAGQVFARDLLEGRSSEFAEAADSLMIGEESWYLRDLILSQISYASSYSDHEFSAIVGKLLELIAGHRQVQDDGLAQILNRYSISAVCTLNVGLKDAVVSLWGNPWLQSSAKRWPPSITEKSRSLITQWLKSEFIEAFFTKMAEDGSADRRRLDFWMSYLDSINTVQFALGPRSMNDRDVDMRGLRKKMDGLITPIQGTNAVGNAFVMTMGNVVAVEFSGQGNALYLYDANAGMPFDLSQPVSMPVNGQNSLKNQDVAVHRLSHQDAVNGFEDWESRFEYILKRPPFSVDRSSRRSVHGFGASKNTENTSRPYKTSQTDREIRKQSDIERPRSTQDAFNANESSLEWKNFIGSKYDFVKLRELAQRHGITIDDFTGRSGNLWVRTGTNNYDINKLMLSWGFKYKDKRGWWK